MAAALLLAGDRDPGQRLGAASAADDDPSAVPMTRDASQGNHAVRGLSPGWPLAAAGLAVGLAAGTRVTVLAMAAALSVAVIVLAPGRPALGGGRLVVRPGPARRRLLVPAQPRSSPATRCRRSKASGRSPCPTPSACRTAGPTSTSPTTPPTPASGATTSRPGSTTPSAPSGRWSCSAPSPPRSWRSSRVATGWSAGSGGVALFGLVAYLFTPLSAAGAEGEPVGFAINIRYVIPALLAGDRPAAAAALLRRPPAASGGCSVAWSWSCSSPTVPTRRCTTRRGSSPWLSCSLVVAGARRRSGWRDSAAPRAVSSPAAAPALAIAAGAIGYPLQRHYLDAPLRQHRSPRRTDPRHEPRLRLPLGPRHRGLPASASPAPRAGFAGYGFYGTDLSNEVLYLGEKGPHGAFNAIPTCSQLPRRRQRRRPRLPRHRALPQLPPPRASRSPRPRRAGCAATRR